MTLASAVAGGAVRRRVPSPAPPAAHRLSMPSALGRRWRPAVRRLSAAWERVDPAGLGRDRCGPRCRARRLAVEAGDPGGGAGDVCRRSQHQLLPPRRRLST